MDSIPARKRKTNNLSKLGSTGVESSSLSRNNILSNRVIINRRDIFNPRNLHNNIICLQRDKYLHQLAINNLCFHENANLEDDE